MLAPSLPLYSESQPACLLCLSQQHRPLTHGIYSKFIVFVFTFLETFSGMLLASIGLVIFDFLIHLKKLKNYYVFNTCCFWFVVVAVVLWMGSIAVCLF